MKEITFLIFFLPTAQLTGNRATSRVAWPPDTEYRQILHLRGNKTGKTGNRVGVAVGTAIADCPPIGCEVLFGRAEFRLGS